MLMTIKHDIEMGWGYKILDANGCVMIMSVKPYSTFGAVIADLHDFMGETVFIA